MADEDGEIYWYSPDPRCIFDLDRFHVPHGLKPVLNKAKFETRIDTAFGDVLSACADRVDGSWINDDIQRVYNELHEMGSAHSVESWLDGELAGGLYGIAINGAFFGESMFHRVTDASKVALVMLKHHLVARGYTLLDTQWTTPHLARFGAIEIPRAEYLRRLEAALELDCRFGDR